MLWVGHFRKQDLPMQTIIMYKLSSVLNWQLNASLPPDWFILAAPGVLPPRAQSWCLPLGRAQGGASSPTSSEWRPTGICLHGREPLCRGHTLLLSSSKKSPLVSVGVCNRGLAFTKGSSGSNMLPGKHLQGSERLAGLFLLSSLDNADNEFQTSMQYLEKHWY